MNNYMKYLEYLLKVKWLNYEDKLEVRRSIKHILRYSQVPTTTPIEIGVWKAVQINTNSYDLYSGKGVLLTTDKGLGSIMLAKNHFESTGKYPFIDKNNKSHNMKYAKSIRQHKIKPKY